MIPVYLSLGSNMGERIENLRNVIMKLPLFNLQISPVYETPALLPSDLCGAEVESWNRPYFNLVVFGLTKLSEFELLEKIQSLEIQFGRSHKKRTRWAPRTIDIDILLYGQKKIYKPNLIVPHSEMLNRSFVLDPLSFLFPNLKILKNCFSLITPKYFYNTTVLKQAKKLASHQPLLMGILNVNPDSFSESKKKENNIDIQSIIEIWSKEKINIIDIGGFSTRPGANTVSAELEWLRLKPVLCQIQNYFNNDVLAPKLSVDTFRAEVARKALDYGATIINDVSGLGDPDMLSLLVDTNKINIKDKYSYSSFENDLKSKFILQPSSPIKYVLTHSLSAPVKPDKIIPDDIDVMKYLKKWFNDKLNFLSKNGVSTDRIVLDPGIGFGKTKAQCLTILSRISELKEFNCLIMVGASRKSFMNIFSVLEFCERDVESLGISFSIYSHIDILRVHDPVIHRRAMTAFFHVRKN